MPKNSLSLNEFILFVLFATAFALSACTQSKGISELPVNSAVPSQTPVQTSTYRWVEYEEALAKVLLAGAYPSESESEGLCEWSILGHNEQEVYVWALCQVASTASGTASSVPVVIKLSPDGRIEEVVIPRDGTDYGLDIQNLFPSDVQERINNLASYFDVKAAMEHIALRREDRTIPPIIVEAGTPLP
ncbi:hypothetical protein BECAL_00615 [Bellilinea caldifistulae]|uniref:Lipoprotein n=1 Tax=Bellilinea caldifistulae TaxID=360411 RepID=A0A0N8GNN9_9CHLR|nr:hypothetical protein [Bellilinea caldifistulae]KPL78626.1 hypothetical protein AC812_00770 [Bellilinea caldifistulae]GAP09471.1 hypothetical protein BECAL_00615 [Bellilinea caldifistulae]GIW61047.1 MAG: hypothetical protein KatS3mg087_2113 [Patescibacteria group bacterium]GIW61072.1 MAG: hypothetical protein KatS3mg087_2138 [Patescibacteria group bacterium]